MISIDGHVARASDAPRNGACGRPRPIRRFRSLTVLAILLSAGTCLALPQVIPPIHSFSGPQGGPFPLAPTVVKLDNPSGHPLQWETTQPVPWLIFSPANGTIPGGGSTLISAAIDQVAAAALAPGLYAASTTCLKSATLSRGAMVRFELHITPLNFLLTLTPGLDFNASGTPGGPFTPTTRVYTLANTGTSSVQWNSTTPAPWLALDTTSGSLLQGQTVDIAVSVDQSVASTLGAGNYPTSVVFRGTGTGTSATLNAALAIAIPPPLTFTNEGYPLGTNLEGLTDWNRALPFTDAFELSRAWIPQFVGGGGPWNTGTPINTDADGWVTSLAPGDAVATLLMTNQDGNYPPGRYLCLYDGDGGTNSDAFVVSGDGSKVLATATFGRFEVDVTPTVAGGLVLKIEAINAADPIRNIRFTLPGFENTYATTDVFHPAFIASLQPFKVLRFMDWGRTNNSTVVTWEGRTRSTYCRATAETGASIESMIALCNKTQKDMWYCIPHMADDDYVTQAATLIRDTLDPHLRLFLENSNEVWNWGFSQATWAHNQGHLLWPGDSTAWLHYYGLRTAQMMDRASAVFASVPGRLVRVMATQSAWPWAGAQCMDQIVSGPGDFAYLHVDALAIAPYFGGALGNQAQAITELMTVDDVLDFCAIDSLVKNGPGGTTEINCNNAAVRGLELIAYEGGQHLVGVGNVVNNQVITDLFIAANRHPRMRQIYADDLNFWTARGGVMFTNFAHTCRPDKWGSWGLLEKATQDPATAYKWLGIQDWLDNVLH